MDTLLATLRQGRDELKDRSAKIAGATRARGLDALGKVRSGALDWRRTLKARRAELEGREGWFRFVGLQRRVIDGVDRVLARFSERVRAEMKRLSRLELPEVVEAAAVANEVKSAAKASAKASSKASTKAKRPAAKAKRQNGAAPKSLVLPIAGYDGLSAKDILAELPRLSAAQCKTLLEHERAHKRRKTVVAALEARLAS